MDSYLKLKMPGKEMKISCLSLILFSYMARRPVLTFGEFFGITEIIAGLFLLLFATSFLIFTLGTKRVCWDGIILVIVMIIFFYVTYLIHPEYYDRFVDIYKEGRYSAKNVFTLWAGIYCYYIFRLFRNNDNILFSTLKAIAITILCFEFWGFVSHDAEYGYDMSFGYRMEMAALIFLADFLQKRNKKVDLVFSLLCMAFALLYGSRAVFIGYGSFIVIYFIWAQKLNIRMTFLAILTIVAGILFSSQTVMYFLYTSFSKIGITSRTLYRLAVSGEITQSVSRTTYIYPVLIDALKKMPVFYIYGAYGDRTLLPIWCPYAHNFILEILLTFGWFLGLAFLFWLFITFIKVIKFDKSIAGLITIILGCFSLCRLIVSSSFWIEPYFWGLIAMLVNYSLNNRHRIESINEA